MLNETLTYPLLDDSRMAQMMHEAGLRPSAHRIAVMSAVCNRRTHPTADEILACVRAEFPTVSHTTIYNALHALADAGLIRELDIEAGTMRYDIAPRLPHSHFICRRCGRIFDMAMPDGLAATAGPGFSIENVDLTFRGICPRCNR